MNNARNKDHNLMSDIRQLQSLEEMICFHGEQHPEQPALTFDGETLSYAELLRLAGYFAGALQRHGIGRGDRIACVLKNGNRFFETLFGARLAGAVYVPVNWRLAAEEMAFVINDSGAKVVLLGQHFRGMLESLREFLDDSIVVLVDTDTPLPETVAAYLPWRGSEPVDRQTLAFGPDEVALQLYTSGTTGHPKGVMLTNRNLFAYYRASQLGHPLPPFGVHLITLPLFHVGGINWSLQGMVRGGHCVGGSDFDADGLLQMIPQYRVTDAIMVPAVVQMMVSADHQQHYDYSSLDVIVYGGSMIAPKLARQALQVFDCVLYGMYGATEVSFGLTLLVIDHAMAERQPQLLNSVGEPLPGTELRIVDPATGEDRPPGVDGEIWIRTAQSSPGYWKNPLATQKTFLADGWFRSGDIGKLIDGKLYVTDRLKDMIISGGENIYPAEVERVLCEHPAVRECAVIGIPDEQWGESVKAFVVRESAISEQALIAYSRDFLAHFKCPKSIEFMSELPKTASGKLLKNDLRKPYWCDRELGVN